jgi:hypothetical protein
MTDQLPAIIQQSNALGVLPDASPIPALIAAVGDQAACRYIDFFTANIRNSNTRRGYARVCGQFFAWCETRGRTLGTIRPFDVSIYIEARQQTQSAPDVKRNGASCSTAFRSRRCGICAIGR